MKKRPSLLVLSACLSLLALSGCSVFSNPRPDYRIKLAPAADGHGYVAIPPECPTWYDQPYDPNENTSWPQFGCAQAKNLAAMIEDPSDLIDPQELSGADGPVAAASIGRYREGKTKQLIDAKSDAPVASMTPTTKSSP